MLNEKYNNEDRYFLESNFVGVNKLFVLIYSNVDDNAKTYQGTSKNYSVLIDGKSFYD